MKLKLMDEILVNTSIYLEFVLYGQKKLKQFTFPYAAIIPITFGFICMFVALIYIISSGMLLHEFTIFSVTLTITFPLYVCIM